MNLRTLIQFLLFVLIIVIFYAFYFVYFKKNSIENNQISLEQNTGNIIKPIEKKASNSPEKEEGDLKNIIKKIEYRSLDRKGNEYIVKAESGKVNFKEKNIMKLKDVTGKIVLVNREPINIYSNYAEYDTVNFDTKFYENVSIQFEDNIVNSDNFDLFIKDNVVKIYNNVILENDVSKVNADILNIDLLNGDISVDMFEESNKIKVLKK